MLLGIQHISRRESKGIDGAVRDLNRANQCRVDGRLQPTSEKRIDGFGINTRRDAGGNKGVLKREIVFGKGNEQPVGRFYTVTGDAFEDLVFDNALAGGFIIGNRIACAAVQQAVITSGGAGSNVMALDQHNV